MLSRIDYVNCTPNENSIATQVLNGYIAEDDTIIYVMGGNQKRVRSIYITNKNVKNNLD